MSKPQKPCDLCGCTKVNLHDGFYFCAECGTQDATFQETHVEIIEAEGGGFLYGKKTKVVIQADKEKEMPEAWYKWHGFNFLLKGTADELIEHGVNPTFKTKLLWVWTRYLKIYLKPEDIGLDNNDADSPDEEPADNEEEMDSDDDIPEEEINKHFDKLRDRHLKKFSYSLFVTLIYIALNLDRSDITLTHLLKLFKDGMLSVPYRTHNLIPPEIKPEKLNATIRKGMTYFKINRIRILAMTLFKRLDLGNPVVPDLRMIVDNYLKELCLPRDLEPLVLSLMHYKPCSSLDVNTKDLLVYKMPAYELQVMTYILWALKLCLGLDCFYEVKLSGAAEAINKIHNRPRSHFIRGESAPTNRLFSFREWVTFYQFRQIMLRYYVHRLANKTSWDTDDYIALEHHMDLIDKEYKRTLKDDMTHDLLNRINEGDVPMDIIPRSEFTHTLTTFHSYTQVIVDHLRDPEIKLKLSEDFSQYSLKYAIINWNLVHPCSKTNRNLVKGIKTSNKLVTNKPTYKKKKEKLNQRMVYVRDCDNHNWLKTKPPTAEHMVHVDNLDSDDENCALSKYETHKDKLAEVEVSIINHEEKFVDNNNEEAKHRIDSMSHSVSEISIGNSSLSSRIQFEDDADILECKLDAKEKDMMRILSDNIARNSTFPDYVSEHSYANTTWSNSVIGIDETTLLETGKLDESEITKLKETNKTFGDDAIKEEAEGVNIFDDDFKLEIKEEIEEPNPCEMDHENTFNIMADSVHDSFQDVPRTQSVASRGNDTASECSSIDSVTFNEQTFDRAKAIKEIIIHTCKKHKLPLPPEYNSKTKSKKEMGLFSVRTDSLTTKHRLKTKKPRDLQKESEGRDILRGFISNYYAAVQEDFLTNLAQNVSTAIQNALKENNRNAKSLEEPPDEPFDANAMDIDAVSYHSDDNTQPVETIDLQVQREENESEDDKLFSEDSDGETQAKDLLPDINPDFDEKDYDVDQLYLKAAETFDDAEMELDPALLSIIDKKMKKDAKDPSLLAWSEEKKKPVRPDSEDEMPLSVLQDLNALSKKLSTQKTEYLSPFLKHNVKNFRYWFKFFPFHDRGVYGKKFGKTENDLPKSFAFVLKECALILGVSDGELFRNLQSFEYSTLEKCGVPLAKHGLSRRGRSFQDSL